jgi:hypothetical protein
MHNFNDIGALKRGYFAPYYYQLERTAWPYIELARINGLVGVWLTFWPCCKCIPY